MSNELAGWKTKIDSVVEKLDAAATGDKAAVIGEVNDLHILVEELEERIGKLRTECPTAFDASKEELEGKFVHMQRQYEEATRDFSPADFGG